MSNQINPLKNQQQINYAQGQIPVMQGQTSDAITQATDNSYLANRAKASKDADPGTTLALTAGIGYGLGQAMDVFNPKCGGKYETSVLGKLGGWGDKFAKNTRVGRFLENGLENISRIFDNWAGKSKIGYSLKHHSTRPDWKLVRVTEKGVLGFLASDTESVFSQFLEPISSKEHKLLGFIPYWPKTNEFQKLEQYGWTQAQINNFANSLKSQSFANQALELQKKELELLGVRIPDIATKTLNELREIAKEAKVKKLGFANLAEFTSLEGSFMDHPDKIIAALEKAAQNDFKISINRGKGFLGKLYGHFCGRQVSISECLNKFKAMTGKVNTTRIGRFLPKAAGWFFEGTTNRFGGGKLAPFMQATIFADMLYHTFKAPKGEKGKTFIERFVNDFTYFVGMVAGLIGMHKFGGFKYLGTNEAGREAYRVALEAFNNSAKAGAFATKADYKQGLKAVNSLLGTKNLNFFQKILQKAATFVNMGNEHAVAYKSHSKVNLNWLRKIANTNIIGVPFRVWLVMMTITPFLAKVATKTVHAIFGKPTNSVLDEDKEEETIAQQSPAFNGQQSTIPQLKPTPLNPNNFQNSNLLKQAANRDKQNPSVSNNTTTTTTTTTAKNTDSNKELEPVRTYIPSPVGMVPQSPDMSALDAALAQADAAEKEIQSILARK